MEHNATAQTDSGTTVLRDHLAADRTILANERTLLAYVRTALTFFVAGVSFIKFFDYLALEIIGYLFIPVAIAFIIVGAVSFRRNSTHITHVTCDGPQS